MSEGYIVYIPVNVMSSAASTIRLRFLALKDDGGPNLRSLRKPLTHKGEIVE